MRRISFRIFICFVTGLLTGILIGCTGVSALVSYRIDNYHEKIVFLKTVIEENSIKYKRLKESLENVNKKKFLVNDIEVNLIFVNIEEDSFDKIELEKYIKKRYKDILWKEVKSIDMDLVVKLIDEDIFVLENKQYRLGVSRVLLSEVFKIWVTVKLME
ncbi:MAG: hypothetical protein ACOYWZ_22755 [Bacillota bacterium]